MAFEKITVLVVDDDEDDFIIIRELLSANLSVTYQTVWADSYSKGIKTLSSQDFDVCLCDYRLGEKNGIEFIQAATAILHHVPVILLTGMSAEFIDIEALRAGAADYLQKNQLDAQVLERSIRYARERKRIDDELYNEKEQILVTLESIGEAVITANRQKEIIHINRIGEELLGMRFEELKGKQFNEVIQFYNEITEVPVIDVLSDAMFNNIIVRFNDNYVFTNRGGQSFAIEATVSPVHNRNNEVIGGIAVILDVSRTRELSKKISYQATHDALTGLINRVSFESVCRRMLANEEEAGENNILLYMDLDGFKIINDTCGHLAGDQLLRSIPELFTKHIRQTDICARLGGDEFGIVLWRCSLEKALPIAEAICEEIKKYQFTWFERVFSIGISIGITAINTLEADSVDDLVSQADEACYVAKNKGGNACHVFSGKDPKITGMYGNRSFALTLNEALQKNELLLFYQPIVPAQEADTSQRIELLVRINDTNGNLVMPGSFLPAASRYKLLTALDKKVIETFFLYVYEHDLQSKQQCYNINISGPTLHDVSFFSFLKELLAKYSIDPRGICFEIMETAAIDYFKTTIEFIQKLKQLGCEFAIDDFGSGVATFSYIKLLPIDYIKIDQTFVQNCVSNEVDEAIIESIHRIARLLHIKTVAEGVENREVYDKVKSLGIDYIQGFFIAKPASLGYTV
ncbi:MAG: EAL domain-containing protein [Spirochaetales bacterium]|nr:EAL domain-containing protein [Spirochaetales bacterium]